VAPICTFRYRHSPGVLYLLKMDANQFSLQVP
jgi:hypothetical protein